MTVTALIKSSILNDVSSLCSALEKKIHKRIKDHVKQHEATSISRKKETKAVATGRLAGCRTLSDVLKSSDSNLHLHECQLCEHVAGSIFLFFTPRVYFASTCV